MKKLALVLLALIAVPAWAGVEDVPIREAWYSFTVSPFEFSENVLEYRQDRIFKEFIQDYEDAYVEGALRTRDVPSPFTSSLRNELGYYEATQTLPDITIPR